VHRAALLVAVIALALGGAAARAGQSTAMGLRFSVPKRWERVQAASEVRGAQYRIPHARGDTEDGELVLYKFTFEDDKGIQSTIDRWYAQFTQPDGRPSKDAATVTTRTVHGLTVTRVALSGTYRPSTGPMELRNKPGYRLLGAAVEGKGGPWFWRAIGPAATMEKAESGFDELIDSLEPTR
jgi:hypothetical protein